MAAKNVGKISVADVEEFLKKKGDWQSIKQIAAAFHQNVMFMSGYLTALNQMKKLDYTEQGVVRLFKYKQ